VILGRKAGAGRGDVQELTLADLANMGVASQQFTNAVAQVVAASMVVTPKIYAPLVNGDKPGPAIVANSDGAVMLVAL
jgi:hypothetical protein